MRITLDGIQMTLGGRRVLDGLSLDVVEGSFYVLIGPTGCGKTTLLRIADLLVRPQRGSVVIDGIDMSRASGRARSACRRRMSMVMQRPYMFSGTVARNVGLGLSIRGTRTVDGTVSRALGSVGLDGFEGRDARTLSGGETQKAAIARALVTRPGVLLLDEPMSSVDPGFRPEIRALLRRLHRDSGMTVIMATHDFADALALGSYGAVILDGAVAQQGSMDDIFTRPATPGVARFVGTRNILHADFDGNTVRCGPMEIRLPEPAGPGSGYLTVPPDAVTIALARPESSQRNVFTGRIRQIERTGWTCSVELDMGGPVLTAQITAESVEALGLRPGLEVFAAFKATSIRILE